VLSIIFKALILLYTPLPNGKFWLDYLPISFLFPESLSQNDRDSPKFFRGNHSLPFPNSPPKKQMYWGPSINFFFFLFFFFFFFFLFKPTLLTKASKFFFLSCYQRFWGCFFFFRVTRPAPDCRTQGRLIVFSRLFFSYPWCGGFSHRKPSAPFISPWFAPPVASRYPHQPHKKTPKPEEGCYRPKVFKNPPHAFNFFFFKICVISGSYWPQVFPFFVVPLWFNTLKTTNAFAPFLIFWNFSHSP